MTLLIYLLRLSKGELKPLLTYLLTYLLNIMILTLYSIGRLHIYGGSWALAYLRLEWEPDRRTTNPRQLRRWKLDLRPGLQTIRRWLGTRRRKLE